MSLKRPAKKLSPYAKYGKRPHEYSPPLQQWTHAAKGGGNLAEAREVHAAFLLRLNNWSKLPGEDRPFMRANLAALYGEACA